MYTVTILVQYVYGYHFSQCHIHTQETIAPHLRHIAEDSLDSHHSSKRHQHHQYLRPHLIQGLNRQQGCTSGAQEEHSLHCATFSQHTYLRQLHSFHVACMLTHHTCTTLCLPVTQQHSINIPQSMPSSSTSYRLLDNIQPSISPP